MGILIAVLGGILLAAVVMGAMAGMLWLLAGSRAEKTINRGFDWFWDAIQRKSKARREESQ